MKRYLSLLLAIIIILSSFTSCKVTKAPSDSNNNETVATIATEESFSESVQTSEQESDNTENDNDKYKTTSKADTTKPSAQDNYSSLNIPDYKSSPYVVVNNNKPYFSANEITIESFEKYSQLDSLGRCGVAFASIGKDLMPTEKRGAIGSVKPSGWHTVKYEFVDGKYLYNRCHLIGYQLTAENANEKNLITGTRYLNVNGMLPFENMVADYIKETENQALKRGLAR